MHIEIITTLPNGKTEIVSRQYQAGQVVKIPASAGGAISLKVDGQPVTGKTLENGNRPSLVRHNDDLVVLIEDQPVAVIEQFYNTPDASLQGSDWVLAQAAGETLASGESADAASAMPDADGSSGNGLYWALGAAGLVGGVAVAAGSGSSGSGGGSSSAVAKPITVSGQVVAGPLVADHGLKVTLYKADGTVLTGPVDISADGLFSAEYDPSYQGVVLARVVDTTPLGPDYVDEATNGPINLLHEMRAVFPNPASGAIQVVVSPLSDLVVRVLGINFGESPEGITAQQITEASNLVAKKVGLDQGVFSQVITVLDAQGQPVENPNVAGLVLTALSGLDALFNPARATELLVQAVNSSGNAEISALLIAGTREAGLASGRDFLEMWAQAAPKSEIATAVSEAAELTDTAIQGWTAEQLSATPVTVIAAMTPAQMGRISAGAISGLTPAQLQVLDTPSLKPILTAAVLSAEQAAALAPELVARALDLSELQLTVRDDTVADAPVAVQADNEGEFITKDSTPALSGTLPVKLPMGAELVFVSNADASGPVELAQDRQSWTWTPVQPLDDGEHIIFARVTLPGGKDSNLFSVANLTTDATPPAVVITADKDLVGLDQTATVRFAFSEGLAGAPDAAQFTVVNGTLGPLQQDAQNPNVYTAVFTPAQNVANGSVASITVNSADYADKAGNAGQAVIFNTLGVDTVAPVVNSVAIAGLNAEGEAKADTLIVGDKIRVTLTMSEPVTISEEASYAMSVGDAVKQARYASGNGTAALVFEYTVQPGDLDNAGGVTAAANALTLGEGGTFRDLAGNGAPAEMPAVAADANAIAVEANGPALSQITVAAFGADNQAVAEGTPARLGGRLDFTVQFSEAPVVTGSPELAFMLGDQPRTAVYHEINGNNAVFRYEVRSGDLANANVITVTPQTALRTTADATIRDNLGNPAVVAENAAFTALAQDTALVDGRQANIESIVIQSATGEQDGWLNATDTVTFRVTFSDEVTPGVAAPILTFMLGDAPHTINYAGALDTATRTLDFTHTVVAGEVALQGISIPANALSLAVNGTLMQNHNPVALNSEPAAANAEYRVDARLLVPTALTVTGLTAEGVAKAGQLEVGEKVHIELQTSHDVTVSGAPQYGFTVNGTALQAAYVPGASKANTLVFEYVVPEGAAALNGEITLLQNALALVAGTDAIRNVAGTVLSNQMIPARAQTGTLTLTSNDAEKIEISADLVKAASVNGAYALVLGGNDHIVPATGMGQPEYGYWEVGGAAYHRRWATDDAAKHLYVRGGEGPLSVSGATAADTTVTLSFSENVDPASRALVSADSWSATGATVTAAVYQENNPSALQLTTAEAVAAPLVLDYTGPALLGVGGEALKYSRLLIGTANEDTLDGSGFAGNQALFANAGGGQMTGGTGSDYLLAGAGADVMAGGAGADTFAWGLNATGADTITDFSRAQGDTIDLSGLLRNANIQADNVTNALQFTRLGDTDSAILAIDRSNAGSFGEDDATLRITLQNVWTELGTVQVQDLVTQEVIRI